MNRSVFLTPRLIGSLFDRPTGFILSAVALLLLATSASAGHVKVFLLGGQSNMVGNYTLTSELPAVLQDPQADVLFYDGGLKTLRPGSGQEFGPEVTFGRSIADAFPSETFCLIKYAVNGSSLLSNWNPATGNSYASFNARVVNGLAALTAAGHTYEIAGMLWTQGEAETGGTTTQVYQAALDEFIADVRTRYGPSLPFFVSRLSNGQTGLPSGGLSTIRAAQEYVAANDPNTYLVDTDGFSIYTDNVHFVAAGQIALGQAFGQSYAASVVPDETGPEIALLSPANGFSGHPATNNLVINFNEPVVFGTGFITVRESAGGTIVESFDVANPPANLDRSLSAATLTIDLSANLSYSTGYYVEIAPTAIADNSGNSFAGFSGPSTWSFTTAAGQTGGLIDGAGITVGVSSINVTGNYPPQSVVDGTGLNPTTGEHGSGNKSEWNTNNGNNPATTWIAFDLGGTYVLESMHVWNILQFPDHGIRDVDIYVSDAFAPGDPEGAGAANWTKIGDNVTFAEAGSPNLGFDLETQTGISLPTTALRHVRFEVNTAVNSTNYVGLAEVQFVAASSGPDTTEPNISSLNPVNGTSGVPTNTNLIITFSEPVAFGTGFITIRESAGGTAVASYDVASPPANLSLSGATLTINPNDDLAASTGYYVEIDSSAIDDPSGNSFAGISGPSTWSFTTDTPDTTEPTISSLNPANGESNVPTPQNLAVTFSEPVAFGTGFITIRQTAGGTPVASYDVANPPANLSLSPSGDTLTINPTTDFTAATGYYVEIAPTAIDDLAGNSFPGISGSATWSFSTAAAPAGGLIDGSGITVTVSSINGTGTTFPPQSVVNGVGLNVTTGVHGSGGNSEWYTNNGQSPANSWISFDLGSSVVLDSVRVWNATQYPGYGIAQLDIYVSTLASPGDPEGAGSGDWTQIGTNVLFTTGAAPNYGFDLETQTGISLPTTAVRHVRFASDTQIGGGSNYLGLAEVQFFAAVAGPGNDFAGWIAGFDIGGQTGIGDDYDNDGLGNALENLMGTSPEVSNPGLTSISSSGDNLVFRHTLSSAPASDLTGSYEWSANLVDWNASGATAGDTTVTFGITDIITPGTLNLVEITANITGTPAAAIFVRYKATQNLILVR